MSTARILRRRDFLKLAAAGGCAALPMPVFSAPTTAPKPSGPIALSAGPHLFIDDHLIAESRDLSRVVMSPQRLDHPVLDNATFGTTQPYLSVFPNDDKTGYRAWYNRGNAVWHAESPDGVKWSNPRIAWDLKRSYGCSLLDDGPKCPDPQRRFKMANWQNTPDTWQKLDDDSGMFVGFSPDGFAWTPHTKNPVLSMWPEGYGKLVAHATADIIDVWRDPLNGNRASAALKVLGLLDEFTKAPRSDYFSRRLVGISSSEDFVNWSRPQRILVPDDRDEGLLEFYGMGGVHAHGPLLIGFARVLRDDLSPEPGGKPDGIGYTVLATSRDGVNWTRDRVPFMDRNAQPKTWDRAMTWVSTVLPVGEELFIYYGGYARGHKEGAKTERQIGLARMPRDRYVARVAGAQTGLVITPPLLLDGEQLTVNAKVNGELGVGLLDVKHEPLVVFGAGDSREHDPRLDLRPLRGKPMRLKFTLRDAELFGFTLS